VFVCGSVTLCDCITKSPAVARVGPTVLVVTDLEGHLRSMIFISSERAYAIFYQ